MTKLVNFEDNIYIIFVRIQMIQDLLALDTDPELFLHKTLDDIEFIDQTLESLLADLLDNKHLIEREGLLNHLSELEWQFSQVLSDFLMGEKLLPAVESPALKEKITIILNRSHERRKKTESPSFTGVFSIGGAQEEPVVSSNELGELLRAL